MAKKEEEKILERQIGDLGGVAETTEEQSLIGQRLRHVPGDKENLTTAEEKDMEAFISRSENRSKIAAINSDSEEPVRTTFPKISEGWNQIDRAEMGIRSQFYPEDWTFYIRPATVEAIKNWSAVEEERIDVVNTVFNDIIRTCVSIKSTEGNIPWSRINSWDRFWFILKVREYTFKKGEAKIEFTDTCPECEQELHYTLEPKSLHYEFPDPDIIDKHWNAYERAWYIDPKEYGLNQQAIKLYIPTLEKDQAILDWGIARARANKKLDQVFLKFLPWMLAKVPKDQIVLERFINECLQTYKSWDVDMFDFMEEVVRNVTINPSENLKQVCPHCGEEVVSNVRFPNGVRALFKTEAKHTKFGSR
jgi:hypothetical protein